MKAAAHGFRVIGLCGRAGAGKDTCAGILAASYGVTALAFADAVREEISSAFGIDPRVLTNRATKELRTVALTIGRADDKRFIQLMAGLGVDVTVPRSPREIMRWWGTEYRRQFDGQDYWCERAHERAEALFRLGIRLIVFTDVRFRNEVRLVKHLGGEIWRVRRRIADQRPVTHVSENQLQSLHTDYSITNDGDMADLLAETRRAWAGESPAREHV